MTEIKTLSKGLKALQIISESETGISTTELSKYLKTDKSSASRILKTLENQNFIQRKKNSRRFVIGLKFFSLTNITRIVYDLIPFSKSALVELVNQTGECAHIAILCEQRALYFDKHETNLSLKVEHSIGTFAPLHSTALGKILIAFNNLNISDYYHNYKNISTDINKLELEIDQIKVNNYSIDDEEYEEGIRCIAAPIYHTYQDRVSAIGISGPINRLNYNSIYKLSKSLKHIASDLSLKIKRLNE